MIFSNDINIARASANYSKINNRMNLKNLLLICFAIIFFQATWRVSVLFFVEYSFFRHCPQVINFRLRKTTYGRRRIKFWRGNLFSVHNWSNLENRMKFMPSICNTSFTMQNKVRCWLLPPQSTQFRQNGNILSILAFWAGMISPKVNRI